MNKKNFDIHTENPLNIFINWLDEARDTEINDPEAFCLATCSKSGQPSARMLLLKEVDERGFKFHTNAESQKGVELAENPQAAMCFYWKSLRRQVRVEGRVAEIGPEEADAYFTTRPLRRRIGAWASDQSRPLADRKTLERRYAEYEEKFAGGDIPRPPHWKGYRLLPQRMEFWFDNEDRLHDRFLFTKQEDGTWSKPQQLYP